MDGPRPATEEPRSQSHFEAALETAQGGVWDWDLTTDLAFHAEWVYRILGVDPGGGAVTNDFWESRLHPEDKDRVMAVIETAVGGRSDFYEAEYRLRHANGSWRWVLDRGRVVERDGGRATRMVGFVVDITDRVRAEEALKASEFRYRTVASMAPGYVFEYRYNARGEPELVWASEGRQAIFEIQESDPPMGWDALIDEEWKPIVAERYARIKQGQPQEGETRIHTASGERKWLHVSTLPVRDPRTGEVTGCLGSAYDITIRKRAEQARRESDAVLRAVTANTPDWLFLIDESLRIRFLNRPFGPYRSEHVLGRSILEFIPAPHRARAQSAYRGVLATGEPARFEISSENSQSAHEHRIVAVIDGSSVRSLTVAVTDITERNTHQDTLKTQAQILETMREGVVLIDTSTHLITLTNATFDRMFGYGALELLGRSIDPLFSVPALQRKRFERTLRDGSVAVETVPVEFECSRKDGSRFVATCVVTPLKMSGSEQLLAVLNDVTERKRLEREIIEISNREQQRIGNDLHDGLGQDLTGIALMLKGVVAQLRKEGSAARLDVEDVIGFVNNAIESTRALARGLSPVSGERGGLAAALQNLAARASERYGIRVEFLGDFAEPVRLSETSATHVYRIVQEALTNVIRHSRATDVTVNLETAGGELHLRVEDNGRGFELSPPDSGGGLGLKIMRYRAQMLGGDLVLESGSAGGALVRCSCPLEGPDSPGRDPAPLSGPPAH